MITVKLRHFYPTLLACIFVFQTKANVEFNLIAQAHNVTFAFKEIDYHEGYTIAKMLSYRLHLLSKALHKDDIKICIEHNIPVPLFFDDTTFSRDISTYDLAVGFERNIVPIYGYKKAEKVLTIYYIGEFNIDKYLQLVYYCLTHIDEIKEKQTLMNVPYKRGSRHIVAVPGERLDIDYTSNPTIERVQHEKLYMHYFDDYKGKISYYVQDGLFYIVKTHEIYKTIYLGEKWVQPKDEELFTLDYITDMVAFSEDYLIYNNRTFYHINADLKISGPYIQPDYKKFFEPHQYRIRHHEEHNNLMTTIHDEVFPDSINIIFDKATKKVTSNHIPVLLARGWPLAMRPDINGRRITMSDIEKAENSPIGGYVLLGILSLNSIAILLTTKRKL